MFAMALIVSTAMLISCSKDQASDPQPSKTYVKAIAGSFTATDGDLTLKDALVVGGHNFAVYKKVTGNPSYVLVDGTEFLPGSAAQLDWAPSGVNPKWFAANTSVYVTYCPVMPLRIVTLGTKVGDNNVYTSLGITDGTPSRDQFPITIKGKRLGDILEINTDDLTKLPGYTNMSFDITYTKKIIDLPGTIQTSGVTDSGWPTYSYQREEPGTAHLSGSAKGNQSIYNDFDAKISGDIAITVNVDAAHITVHTTALGLGHGLRIKLTTNKVGWYNSGTIGLTDDDVIITEVPVEVK